ncbi:hypothetical protein [Microbacterium aurum]
MSMSHRLGRMSGRDPREPHRAATPPELLFDLTFVKRYSLLVIIALGEVVLGTILTISAGVQENQWTVDAGVLAVGGTALAWGLLIVAVSPAGLVVGYEAGGWRRTQELVARASAAAV